MEKSFNKPEYCQQCGEVLGKIFWVCRSCDTFICHDCFKEHDMNHDYLPCKTIEEQKAMVINVGMAGYGPPQDEWPSLPIEALQSNYNQKCVHAEDYFNNNNIVFFCEQCRIWLCYDCINEHLNHGLMAHVGFDKGKRLRQIDPKLYPSENQLLVSINAKKTDNGNIKIELDLGNDNNVPLYDLTIMYTWDGLYNEIWDKTNLETINDKVFACNTVKKLEEIPPYKTIRMNYELNFSEVPNLNLSSIITIVRFRDVLEGNGVSMAESTF